MSGTQHTPGRLAHVETPPDRAIDYNSETFIKAEANVPEFFFFNRVELIAQRNELVEALEDLMRRCREDCHNVQYNDLLALHSLLAADREVVHG
jgi:hypothetical protein